MKTNMTIIVDSKLGVLGRQLMETAHEFWVEHQKVCGSSAVVWLEDYSGHFILFTRGEYKQGFIKQIWDLRGADPLDHPFEVDVGKLALKKHGEESHIWPCPTCGAKDNQDAANLCTADTVCSADDERAKEEARKETV